MKKALITFLFAIFLPILAHAALVPNGGVCKQNNVCQSGFCSGGRCAPAPLGNACTANNLCQSGYCSGGVCSLKPVGVSCTNNDQCQTNLCQSGTCEYVLEGGACTSNGQCETNYCSGAICNFAPLGNSCSNNNQCQSSWCNGGVCDIAALGESCTSDTQCEAGYCSNGTCVLKPVGSYCANNNQCRSNYCSNNVCQLVPELGACSDNAQCQTNVCSPAGFCRRPGEFNVAVCLMRWDAQTPPIDPIEVQAGLEFVKDWYQEVSYGQVDMNFQYVGNEIWSGPAVTEDDPNELYYAVQACDPFIDFRTVDDFVLYPSTRRTAANGGLSNTVGGGFPFVTQEGNIHFLRINTISYSAPNSTFPFWAHEFGHAFGLSHSPTFDCSPNSFQDDNIISPTTCVRSNSNRNMFTAMGLGSEGHFVGWDKIKAGPWGSYQTITQDGSYSLKALEVGSATLPHTLRIPFQDNPLCIEYRKPLGIDQNYDYSYFQNNYGTTAGIPPEGCLFLNLCTVRWQEEMLIDATPNSITTHPTENPQRLDFHDSCLLSGTTFSNADLGVSLSFSPAANDSALIQLNILDETQVQTQPDLTIGGYGFRNSNCINPYVSFYTSNEKEVATPFTVKVMGLDSQGHETFIRQVMVSSLRPGEYLQVKDFDASPFHSIKAILDDGNVVSETNESNNIVTFPNSCFTGSP